MVFYFTSRVVDPPVTLFMGNDKYENEDLIKWGWEEDVWFHVDKVSSAHVYLRLNQGQTIDDIPMTVIEDAAQLCKANSIQGNKMNNVDVVYTLWSNLRKTPGMDVGQVGFHSEKEVRKIRLEKRSNEVVNRLNKTKVEGHPNLRQEREDRDKLERNEAKKELKDKQQKEKEELEKRKKELELKNYTSLFSTATMKTNKDAADEDSDDFM
ncbi:coiled-coil domain-containing protein 25-like [Eriocheir sinensis]|uniref:coiled-coil domain-containing protein 25-like n=1 Tax=Eriocheir sinensis TaxID=95602 RepID=UPI0021C82065|nr:coiled-coil domain-containing protein 25-like [Eriocheir sinensis]